MEKLITLVEEMKALHGKVIFSSDLNHGEIKAILNMRFELLIKDNFLTDSEADEFLNMVETSGVSLV